VTRTVTRGCTTGPDALHRRRETLSGVRPGTGDDVRIRLERDRGVLVPEPLADDVDRDASDQQEGGVGVALVVEADAGLP
jgi:hypothetical protein